MRPVIVFDVNETLLDLAALDETFGRLFPESDAAAIRRTWFNQVLELFLTATVVHQYRSFDKLIDDALQMVSRQRGRERTEADRDSLTRALAALPAHADARPALERLKSSGFTMAALTNSKRASAVKQLEGARLRPYLDAVLSADDVERYKPAREAYEHAARELSVGLERIVLVAAHSWDVAGALAAGCQAAFVARPGQTLSPGVATPAFQGRDLGSIADQLIARYPD